jgi:hypothetical protein
MPKKVMENCSRLKQNKCELSLSITKTELGECTTFEELAIL